MKTNYILLAALFLFSVHASAQSNDDFTEKVAFGVKAGINTSRIYDTKGEDFESEAKIGLAAGAFLSVPIGKFLGFQPEFMYSQKGYRGSGNLLIVNYEYTRSLDYIDIPLQLQIKPIPALTLLIGPQYSFLVRKGIDFDAGGISVDQQDDIENDNIRKNTLGAIGGLDIHMRNFVLSGRVSWDLQHNDGEGTSVSPRYRNALAQITLGIMF